MSAARSVIVTGGTGALGRAVVAAFLAGGDRVVVPWIVAAERDAVASTAADAVGSGRLVLVESDVADAAAARALVQRAGEPAVLVNGVGGFAAGAHVEVGLDVWDRMYRMNVRTTAAAAQAVLPGMLARGRGAIVNIAANAALDPPAGMSAYVSSKAALVAMTRSLAREVGPRGVRVNAVLPTTIDTPANRAAMPDADFSQWTRPESIAAVIHWLASDAAAAVRGALVPV
ncbi:MAG TPA: SDR family NAD(P)-dependent oxidoreductase [Myxococcota bacterium]|nr:SDR family NAD(P)-dependent oxidoreductase [Myxococcota bacterium]